LGGEEVEATEILELILRKKTFQKKEKGGGKKQGLFEKWWRRRSVSWTTGISMTMGKGASGKKIV